MSFVDIPEANPNQETIETHFTERVAQMAIEPEIGVFRLDRPGIRKALGDFEADIMEVIWARPTDTGTTVREVFEILYKNRRIAYTSVMTTMTRLAKKKLLWTEKGDKAYVYYPNFTQPEFVRVFVGHILENLRVGFTGEMLQGLDARQDQDAASRLQQLLVEIERRRNEQNQK